MRTIARILAPLLLTIAALNAATDTAHAHDDDTTAASSCRTTTKGDRHITAVRWTDGTRTRYTNLNATRAPFPGAREVTRSRPGWRKYPTVIKCKVLESGAVTVRTSRARLAYTPTAAPAVVVEVTPPTRIEPPRPDARGRWATAVTVYAPVADDWQIDAVLAAWNAALPADRQLTRVYEPCTNVRTCIDVEELPIARLAELYLAVWGLAWWVPVNGTMEACSIDLALEVPSASRGSVFAHELGHCLGLPHWDHSASVMTSAHSEHAALPSAIDLEWIVDTYTAQETRP